MIYQPQRSSFQAMAISYYGVPEEKKHLECYYVFWSVDIDHAEHGTKYAIGINQGLPQYRSIELSIEYFRH